MGERSSSLLIFKRQPGCQVELQKGLDRLWLSGNPSSTPPSSSSYIYCLCKHLSASPTHLYPTGAHSAINKNIGLSVSEVCVGLLCVCLLVPALVCAQDKNAMTRECDIYCLVWKSLHLGATAHRYSTDGHVVIIIAAGLISKPWWWTVGCD